MADADSASGDLVLSALAGTPVGGLFSQLINKAGRGVRDSLRSGSDRAVAEVLTQPGGLATAQEAAARASQPLPPPLLITGGAGAGAVQGNAERGARPTINSLIPAVRQQLAAGVEPDIGAIAQESGATRTAVRRAIYLARKERQVLAEGYQNPLMAKHALRKAGLNQGDYLIAKGASGAWEINSK